MILHEVMPICAQSEVALIDLFIYLFLMISELWPQGEGEGEIRTSDLHEAWSHP
jgi:hypothetical protein